MPIEPEDRRSEVPLAAQFATTHWSVVLAAANPNDDLACDALEKLCRTYWYPLYAYVRRRGYGPEDAQDLTQEFFARLLTSTALREVAPQKGRFRAFLLATMKHFLANEWDRGQALKRGGHLTLLSWEQTAAEERYRQEPADEATPERLFERRWVLALLDRVLDRLRAECATAAKAGLFDQLRPFLADVKGTLSHAEAAARTGLSEVSVRQAVRRLRARYRELIREEIAHTVDSPQEIDAEIRHLFTVFGN